MSGPTEQHAREGRSYDVLSNIDDVPSLQQHQQCITGQQAGSCSQKALALSHLASLLHAGPRMIWASGMTCSFLASLIFSFSALFVKLTAGRVPVLEVCLIRSSISFGLSLILMHLSGMSYKLFFGRKENLRLLFLRGCCGACSMTTYYIALFMLPLGDAVTINLIGPPVTALFARMFLKEPLGYRGLTGCCISLAGVVLVARPPFLFGGHEEWARSRAIGTLAGVTSAVLGGGSSMTIRLIGGSEPAAVIAIWFHTATMLLSLFPLLTGVPNKAVTVSPGDGGYMIGVAGTSFVAQLLSTRGLQRCQAAKAAAMGFTQVVYSNIMGAVFFNERLTSGGLLGALLILAGVLLVTMRPAASNKAPSANNCIAASMDNTARTATAAAAMCGTAKGLCMNSDEEDALLSGHVGSHVPAVAAADNEACDAAALAVVKLRPSNLDVAKITAGPAGLSDDPDQQQQQLEPEHFTAAELGAEGCCEHESEKALLAEVAASAAAALGGELCPAGSTATALAFSRQVSRQSRSCTVSQMSRQPSQWPGGLAAGLLGGTLDVTSLLGLSQQPQQGEVSATQQNSSGMLSNCGMAKERQGEHKQHEQEQNNADRHDGLHLAQTCLADHLHDAATSELAAPGTHAEPSFSSATSTEPTTVRSAGLLQLNPFNFSA